MTDLEKTVDDLKLLNALCHGTVLDDAINLIKEQREIIKTLAFHDGMQSVLLDKKPDVVRCKDCRYATRHCCDSVFGKPLYDCKHIRQIGREGTECHSEDWFCADGEKEDAFGEDG